jgi:hypothetical protein
MDAALSCKGWDDVVITVRVEKALNKKRKNRRT